MPTEVDYDRICEMVKKCMGKTEVADKWVLVGVNFDFNQATLRNESYPILDNAAGILLSHPDVNVEIQGHTDQIGSDKYNEALSMKRAEAVKKYLVAKGVDAGRLTTSGKGKSTLLFKESYTESRFYNRRVEFHIK
jgi:OOP family OmpA-OmpF porin